jgi:hypothetical protein
VSPESPGCPDALRVPAPMELGTRNSRNGHNRSRRRKAYIPLSQRAVILSEGRRGDRSRRTYSCRYGVANTRYFRIGHDPGVSAYRTTFAIPKRCHPDPERSDGEGSAVAFASCTAAILPVWPRLTSKLICDQMKKRNRSRFLLALLAVCLSRLGMATFKAYESNDAHVPLLRNHFGQTNTRVT